MDLILGLPKTKRSFNIIWEGVDILTKTTHFIPGKSTYRVDRWAQLYIREIVRLHGVPVSIISNQNTVKLWSLLLIYSLVNGYT